MTAKSGQPGRFVLVGAIGYAGNLLAFAALHGLGMPYGGASLVAYFSSNALMYLGNRYFTFRLSNDGFLRAYVRYVLVGAAVAGLTAALLAGLVEGAGADPRLGQALALATVTPIAFALNKRWTFRLTPA